MSAADASSEEKPVAKWAPVVVDPLRGAPWSTSHVKDSLRRVRQAPGTAEMAVQAQIETMVLVHSIRRILLWSAVIVPVIAGIAVLVLANVGEAAGCTPSYYKTC